MYDDPMAVVLSNHEWVALDELIEEALDQPRPTAGMRHALNIVLTQQQHPDRDKSRG